MMETRHPGKLNPITYLGMQDETRRLQKEREAKERAAMEPAPSPVRPPVPPGQEVPSLLASSYSR